MISSPILQHDAFTTTDQPAAFALHNGRVLRRTAGAGLIVIVEGHECAMNCAASCLLVPEPGDLVLVAGSANESYVLAVLERPGAAPATIAAAIPSQTTVLAASKLELRAEEDLEITAPATSIKGRSFTVAVDALSFVAKLLTQALGRWQSAAKTIDTIAEDLATKAARRVTVVDETDMLQAGGIVHKVDAASITTAQAVVIVANEDLRLDGARVTMG